MWIETSMSGIKTNTRLDFISEISEMWIETDLSPRTKHRQPHFISEISEMWIETSGLCQAMKCI